MTCNGMSSSLFPSSFLFQMQAPNEEEDRHHQHGQHQLPTQLFPSPPPAAPQDYHGLATMLGKRSMSFPAGLEACCGGEVNGGGGGEDDLSDDCSQAGVGERKRRLNMEQVRALEKSFELGSKLEPERKMQLARALGLQPRQIAIWFQNRRARWKTKQLEKDYDILKQQFEAVKTENESLHAKNKKLQAEVMVLRGRETTELINLNKETDQGSCSNRSENSSDINLDISTAPTTESPLDPSPQNRLFFQAARPPLAAQQFLSTTRADQMQSLKTEQGGQDDGFCSMFCGLDDQSGFWNAWPDQQNFH